MSIRLMSRVWDETKFKGTELLVLLTMADHANDEGVCWPSLARIAVRARCTRRQVSRCMERLKAEGWITVIGKKPVGSGNLVNVYRIGLNPSGDILPPPPKKEGQRGDILDKGGDKKSKKVVTPMSTESSGEPSKESASFLSVDQISGLPPIEDAHAIVMESTSLNDIQGVTCVDRWMRSVVSPENWQDSLREFAIAYEQAQ